MSLQKLGNEQLTHYDCEIETVKFFLVVPLHFFGSKSAISRSGERFRDGRYGAPSHL